MVNDWVLIDESESKRRKRAVFLEKLTKDGIKLTSNTFEAQRFYSRKDAITTKAYTQWLSSLEPIKLLEAIDTYGR